MARGSSRRARSDSPSADALEAAKAFVAYIEAFRSGGTGELMRRYPDDDPFGGYDNIVRRARQLVAACERFDSRGDRRHAERLSRAMSGYVEVDPVDLIDAALRSAA